MRHESHRDGRSERGTRPDFMSGLNDALRQNPVPAALVGMGILWLFTGGRNVRLGGATHSIAGGIGRSAYGAGGATYRGVRSAVGRVGDGLQAAAEGAEAASATVAETAREAAGVVGSTFTSAGRHAGEAYDQAARAWAQGDGEPVDEAPADRHTNFASAQETLADLFARQPLMLGAVGLAIGAAVAASLPTSKAEDRLMGETAEAVKDRAGQLWDEAKAAGAELTSKALEEADAQGLTPKAVGAGARDVGSRLAGLADKVAGDLADTVRR